MLELPPNANHQQVIERARQHNLPIRVLGHSPAEQEIIVIRAGGQQEPAILITAGAHADEPSGPFGALALLWNLKTEYTTYFVPLRDPFAWDGFTSCLSFALGRDVVLENHDQAEALLRSAGSVHFDLKGILVVEIGSLCFAFKHPGPDTVGPREIWSALSELLPQHPDVIETLLGKRIILPSNLEGIEGCGAFDRAYTIFITPSGQAGNLNRYFGEWDQPPEVRFIQQLYEEIRPGLVLDLHEGQGSDYYVFASGEYEARARRLAEAMIGGVHGAGHPTTNLDRLRSRITPSMLERMGDGGEGIIVADLGGGDAGKSLATFTERPSVGFTTETGRWTSLATRVGQQVVAAQATVREYEKMFV